MTTILDIYTGAERFINEFIRKEMVEQGHHLTGDMEDSLTADIYQKGKAAIMEGLAVGYTRFVDQGFPAQSASFKQVPFLIEYFIKRGFPVASSNPQVATATSMAFATVRKWMKEGMPTEASKRFSTTGSRTNMIENAFVGANAKLDEYMLNSLDFIVEEKFQKEKSETI